MKASELAKELACLVEEHGDCEVNISIKQRPDDPQSQGYLMSEPSFVVFEPAEDGDQVSIRDWPY